MKQEKDSFMFKKRLLELAEKAYQQNRYMYTPFLDLYEQSMYQEERSTFSHVTSCLYGGHSYADRQIVCFGNQELFGYEEQPPIVCVQIIPNSKKFANHLTHRDFLGAIMNLGIERPMIGDILIADNVGYVFCLEHIAPFITEQLFQIKQTMVTCHYTTDPPHIEPNYQEITGFVQSCRLDTMIGLAFQLSRSQSIPYIQGKKVFVNGKLMESNSFSLKEGMIISVRGLGKFIFDGVDGTTKKGRNRILLRKFI